MGPKPSHLEGRKADRESQYRYPTKYEAWQLSLALMEKYQVAHLTQQFKI